MNYADALLVALDAEATPWRYIITADSISGLAEFLDSEEFQETPHDRQGDLLLQHIQQQRRAFADVFASTKEADSWAKCLICAWELAA